MSVPLQEHTMPSNSTMYPIINIDHDVISKSLTSFSKHLNQNSFQHTLSTGTLRYNMHVIIFNFHHVDRTQLFCVTTVGLSILSR